MAHAFPGTNLDDLTVGEFVARVGLAHQIVSERCAKGYADNRTQRYMANMGAIEQATEDLPI